MYYMETFQGTIQKVEFATQTQDRVMVNEEQLCENRSR